MRRASIKCGKAALELRSFGAAWSGENLIEYGLRAVDLGKTEVGLFTRCKPCDELLPGRKPVCNLAFSRQ